MCSLDKENKDQKMNKLLVKCLAAFPLLFVSATAFANSKQSLGQHVAGHGVSEISNFFSFLSVGVAFIGFAVTAACLVGMATIKLYANSPMGQKAEAIGMMNFFIGGIIGAALAALGTIFYMFVFTAVGSSADTSAFDKLKSSSIEMKVVPVGQVLVDLDTPTIEAQV